MADLRVSDPAKARFNWADTINATKEVVKILIEYKVDIEARNQSRLTPLYVPFRNQLMPYSAIYDEAQKGWLEGHAVIALIEAGANTKIDLGNGDRSENFYDNILDVWMDKSCEDFCHSETYRDVLLSIIQRVEDLDPPNTYCPLMHRAIRVGTGPHSGEALRCLTSKLHPKPASVDSLNEEGDTPLLSLLSLSDDVSKNFPETALEFTINAAKALLECGAQIDFTSESGNTAILSAIKGSEFGAEDWAYFRLSEAFIYVNRERAKAIGKSRYQGHSEVVKILQSYGIERTRPEEPDNEPTYFNEVTMPRSSFFNFSAAGVSTTELREGEIPRNEDWKFLYELEILDEQWESKVVPQLTFIYTKLRAWPRPRVLDRWPQLQTMIPPEGDRAWLLDEFWLHVWRPPRPKSENYVLDDITYDLSDSEHESESYHKDGDSQEYEDDQSFDGSDPGGDDHGARSDHYDSEEEWL
ncbi:hypothetical protein TWF788_003662 [Orbilia oligospora]|uniref:Uncharacterized protein n=1 Tax=Orbilia oligospora TaxID=2813651 RepID=A0A7C8K8I6_ORBOL|nr:hypothetical protein TWF788_003662 [Orbilia oligospora]